MQLQGLTCDKKLSPKLITASRCPAGVQLRVSLQVQQGFSTGSAAVRGHLLGRCPVRQLEDGAELELIEPTEGANEMTQGGAKEYEM